MRYTGEINPHKFDGDWHPKPPSNNEDLINGDFQGSCDTNKYKNLMLTNLVKADILKTLRLELQRYNSRKRICISTGDKVEVIYYEGLSLKYNFGRVINFDTNRMSLDCSDSCSSSIVNISISDIRDIEIFFGTFILDPDRNNSYSNNDESINDHNYNIEVIPTKYYTQDNIDIIISWMNGSSEDQD